MQNISKNIVANSLILLGSIFFSTHLYSQNPWNAKVMLHSENGYIDTLWIGCDLDGDVGYQPGLDIIDTTFVSHGGIWGYDPTIPVGECFNLKKDIKDFVSGIQTFYIQLADSTFDFISPYDYLSIDTSDFKFDNGNFKITCVYLECENGYIISIDKFYDYLYAGYDTSYSPIFLYDSIPLIFEPDTYDCLSINDYQMSLKMEVWFNLYLPTSIDYIDKNDACFFPNPSNGLFTINSENGLNQVTIVNQMGERVYRECLRPGFKKYEINADLLNPGVYIVLMESTNSQQNLMAKKLIIF